MTDRLDDAQPTMHPVTMHPVQTVDRKGGKLRTEVTLAAYEVYCDVYGPQEARRCG